MASVCPTITGLADARYREIDVACATFYRSIDEALAVRANQPINTHEIRTRSRSKFLSVQDESIFSIAVSAKDDFDEKSHEERLRMAYCARESLNLVLSSFEVLADGDKGAIDDFPTAILDAIYSVQSLAKPSWVNSSSRAQCGCMGNCMRCAAWTAVVRSHIE